MFKRHPKTSSSWVTNWEMIHGLSEDEVMFRREPLFATEFSIFANKAWRRINRFVSGDFEGMYIFKDGKHNMILFRNLSELVFAEDSTLLAWSKYKIDWKKRRAKKEPEFDAFPWMRWKDPQGLEYPFEGKR